MSPPGTLIRSPGASCASIGCEDPSIRVVVGLMPAARVSGPDVAYLLVGHQGDDGARRPGARRTSRAVQVGLVLDRRVGVDDQRHVVDVDAAGGDVGGDQGRGLAGVEGRHVAGAGALAEVAVQLDGGNAALVELAGERLGTVLGPGEDHRAAGGAGEVDQHRDPVLAADVQHVVVHRRRSATATESASWVTGDLRNRLTRTSIALSSVAENSSRWPSRGVWSSRRRTDGRKPRSAMWSASSRTVTSTEPREQWPWPIRSSSRPGQARTMSAPRRRPWTCGFWPTPPKTVWVVRPAAWASGLSASWIWPTSSRVGARISARGAPLRVGRSEETRRATSGSRNA